MLLKPTNVKRAIFFIFSDIFLSFITLYASYKLRFNFEVDDEYLKNFSKIFTTLVFLKIIFLHKFNIYSVAWRFFSLNEAKKLLYAHLIAYGIFSIFFYAFQEEFNPFPRSVIIIDMFLSFVFLGSLRMSKRLMVESERNISLKKTMIIGATPLVQTLLKQQNEFYIASILDDSQTLIGSYISNIKVHSFNELEKQIQEENITCVVIAKDLEQITLSSIYKRLNHLKIYDILIATISKKEPKLKSLSVEDLLARHPKDLDKQKISQFIKNKIVLVTGAGGSIGSQICRQCISYGAKELILLDHSEYNLYMISEELSKSNIHSILQSVTNLSNLETTFKKFKPDIVIHAAAYKHVPLCEDNIEEAIENNIMGTKNTIDCAIKNGVSKFVLISTDKAVRPTNVMGATKRVCELYASNVECLDTEIVSVRFGNVLGSSGSVIPKFKDQIDNGGPVTVTHPEITRYFMLIPEACELVLQAASIGHGGEIFILDMGEPVKIVELAQKMIKLSGQENIDIKFIGLRPGEKLYEELLINESDATTEYESIMVAGKTDYDIDKLLEDIQNLFFTHDKISALKNIVPEFQHNTNNK